MNKLLIQNVTILDKQSEHHNKVADVLIADGVISEIGKLGTSEDLKVLDGTGQYLSPGFFDMNVNFGEPGLETKEDIESGSLAAMTGGFTGLALMPNTQPPVHSKSEVAYLVNRSKGNLVDIFPLGSISRDREGKELAELYDMELAGAIAFTDGDRPVNDAGLMSRALLYSKGFDGLVMSYAEDKNIAANGQMNEGVNSTLLGMKGNPALAEELMVIRDLYLAEYNDSRIHFSTISTAGSVDLIRQARQRGVRVTCDVAAHHLVFTDEMLSGFDSNYKVKPPLRSSSDVEALLVGLKDGTIDAIVSQHTPHEKEFKDVEFEIASNGIIGLQTVLPLALKAGLSPELIVEKLAVNPRKILKLEILPICAGNDANCVLFDPNAEWIYSNEFNFSRSANSPFLQQTLKGKVTMVFNNSKKFLS
ncbi:dihydroorotase [Flavihumibacter sp. R14]|nr:dihydroorotase [Flavihumibacter soli]